MGKWRKQMKKHVKLYIKYFNYALEDVIPCEICGARAVDVHHIYCRGMGGSKDKDHIDNLMGLCRGCHIEYGDKKQHIDMLNKVHSERLKNK